MHHDAQVNYTSPELESASELYDLYDQSREVDALQMNALQLQDRSMRPIPRQRLLSQSQIPERPYSAGPDPAYAPSGVASTSNSSIPERPVSVGPSEYNGVSARQPPGHVRQSSGGPSHRRSQRSVDGMSISDSVYGGIGEGSGYPSAPYPQQMRSRGPQESTGSWQHPHWQQPHQQYDYQPSPGMSPGPATFSPDGMYADPGFGQAPQNVYPPLADDSYGYSMSSTSRPPSLTGSLRAPNQPLLRAMSSVSSLSPMRTPPQLAPKRNNPGQPITKAAIDEYRNRIKTDPDPEIQFNFAKYLIEAARKLGQACSGAAPDEAKSLKRYRDALLQESVKLIKKVATQATGPGKLPFPDAQFFYANCLSSGSLGLSVDHEKAYTLYVQASKQNHPAATYRTAVSNEVGAGTKKDPNRAVLFYRKASALGDTAGMYKLGMILLKGMLFQQRNGREAVLWLKRAAQQADEDHPHALHELGLLYERPPNPNGPLGLTVPMDEPQALELFTQAARLGYGPSQHKLGMAYEFGNITCPVDPRRSIAYYTRAAERGEPDSELALSGWYLTGNELPFACNSFG